MSTIFQTLHHASPLGFSYEWRTSSQGHIPMHWHEEMEILYLLNGEAILTTDGIREPLKKRHLKIVEERKIHGIHCLDDSTMFLCVHISKEQLKPYLESISQSAIVIQEDSLNTAEFQKYLSICRLLDNLTRRYMVTDDEFQMEADGILMQATALLLRHFSADAYPAVAGTDPLSLERIRTVISYVEENYREPLALADGADRVGLGREAFSRFFKKMMGMSFLQYVNEVRLSHAYTDLMRTDLPIRDVMEQNGLANQKLYNRLFKEYYRMTPSQARRHPEMQDRAATMYGLKVQERKK